MIDYQTLHSSQASTIRKRAHLSVVSPSNARNAAAAPRSTPEASDAQLLAAVAQRRDEAAFEQLHGKHVAGVTKAALQICRSKAVAEEIAQRTFMTLWERAERLASKSVRLRPWLITVARNASIDYLRSKSTLVPLTHAAARASDVRDPQEIAVSNATLAELRQALDTLPAQQRSVIELMYFEGLTFQAIADTTGVALGTVKSRAYLALGRLRRSMCEKGCNYFTAMPSGK